MFSIFLLPVCLTYWPRKYTTRVDPRVDNSHQVWSWYYYPLRVIAFLSAHTSRDLDLWLFDLEQLMCMAGHVTNLATKFKHPMPICSWFMSYNVSPWLPLRMCTRPLRMRRITWPVNRVSKKLHFWNPRPRFAYSLYNFFWATTTIKGRLPSSVTNAKALDCVNFLCVTFWPWPLTFWSLTFTTHGSRDQPCHQVWRPYDYSFMSYEL